jgi:hypothetical protein
MSKRHFFPLSTLFVPFGGASFLRRWEFFPSTLELFSQGVGTFFPTPWDFLPKALGLFSQGVGTFFPTHWDFFPDMVGKMRQYGGPLKVYAFADSTKQSGEQDETIFATASPG